MAVLVFQSLSILKEETTGGKYYTGEGVYWATERLSGCGSGHVGRPQEECEGMVPQHSFGELGASLLLAGEFQPGFLKAVGGKVYRFPNISSS